MKPETYFNKFGKIYGVSEKYEFGKWNGYSKVFTNFDEALKWLHTEENDFRCRKLCSKTEAKEYNKNIDDKLSLSDQISIAETKKNNKKIRETLAPKEKCIFK